MHAPTLIKWQDKLEHIIAFGTLALFICRSFNPESEFSIADRTILAILIIASYGSFSEVLQSIVPNRDPSLMDLAADLVGAFLGGMLFKRIPFLQNHK